MTDTKSTVKKTTTKVTKEKTPAVSKKETAKPSVSADKFAVIKTGGKQYVVFEGKSYEFEKIDLEVGKEVEFEALLVADGGNVKVGNPVVSGSKIKGKITEQFKDDKVNVLKYKPKKRYRKVYGHRQSLTKVEITKIS